MEFKRRAWREVFKTQLKKMTLNRQLRKTNLQ